jgi:MFS family permease
MQDAINNLGGGGLSSPYLANLATALSYVMSTLMTFVGGPIINKIGIKWACMVAAVFMPLGGAGYYVRARYKIDSFLLAARAIGGFTNGFLYVGETAAMMSYPDMNERGRYLGIWSAMRNSGSVVGGAINFVTNHKDSGHGGIAWSTYLIFIGFGGYSVLPKIRPRGGNSADRRVHRCRLGWAVVANPQGPTVQRRPCPSVGERLLVERVPCAWQTSHEQASLAHDDPCHVLFLLRRGLWDLPLPQLFRPIPSVVVIDHA